MAINQTSANGRGPHWERERGWSGHFKCRLVSLWPLFFQREKKMSVRDRAFETKLTLGFIYPTFQVGLNSTNNAASLGSANNTPSNSASSPKTPHHERTKSSPTSLIDFSESNGASSSSFNLDSSRAWFGFGRRDGRVSPRYETPPGTPPPPYRDRVESPMVIGSPTNEVGWIVITCPWPINKVSVEVPPFRLGVFSKSLWFFKTLCLE